MKKLFLTAGLFLLMICFVNAQILVPEQRAKDLQAAIKLTDAQTVKITQYYKALKSQIDSLDKVDDAPAEAYQKLMSDTKKKIQSVLTREQNERYEKWLEDNQKKPAPQDARHATRSED